MNTEKIAKYIISMTKSVGKDIKYALDIVCWYTMTEKQDMEVSEYIKNNF